MCHRIGFGNRCVYAGVGGYDILVCVIASSYVCSVLMYNAVCLFVCVCSLNVYSFGVCKSISHCIFPILGGVLLVKPLFHHVSFH